MPQLLYHRVDNPVPPPVIVVHRDVPCLSPSARGLACRCHRHYADRSAKHAVSDCCLFPTHFVFIHQVLDVAFRMTFSINYRGVRKVFENEKDLISADPAFGVRTLSF